MSHPGRKPQGANLVEELTGSAHAKQRARLFIETLAGEKLVSEACAELGVGESRFFALRGEWLQQGVEFLEPRPPGRPPKIEPAESAELRALRRRVRELEGELLGARIREDLRAVLPHVVHDPPRVEKKGDRRC
jgi:hypothetical protein